MIPDLQELTIISKKDGTYVVMASDNIPVHITPDYNPELYSVIDEEVRLQQVIPIVYDMDAAPDVPEVNLVEAARVVIEECRDLRELNKKQPISSAKFIELVTWSQELREWDRVGFLQGAPEPVQPKWFKKFASTYFPTTNK